MPSITSSLLHLGLPAVIFGSASLLLRKEKDDSVTRRFEILTVILITIMAYYFSRHGFPMNEKMVPSTFIERGVLTNIFFLYGFVALWLGKTYTRDALTSSGIGLIGLALLRILFFDLLIYNPVWSYQYVGIY